MYRMSMFWRRIQEETIPGASRWAKESGATLKADKTSLIHFARRAQQDDSRPIWFEGKKIRPQHLVKVLGVTLDKKLIEEFSRARYRS
jgi:hypothetical protein